MPFPGFELAQVNIGRVRGAMDQPVMAGFVAQLATINQLADQSPGFVWRLQTEDGDATAVRPYADDRILINLSVWEDLPPLQAFVFQSAHTEVMRRRREWFERFPEVYVALWWVPAGHRPSVTEAVERLAHLKAHGPSAYAFTFREPYDPSGQAAEQSPADECPAS
jgi:Domain of unknown function (DUF3291)